MTSYQSFDDRKGASQSSKKLLAIKMPNNLNGKRVLDLGCNEGFFSLEAKRRGAAEVIGIDRNSKHIPIARERAAREGLEIDFRNEDMLNLAEGKFDVIIFLSAIYYLDNPADILRRIREKLTDKGFLILELGVDRRTSSCGVVRALRSRDEQYFPTERLLIDVWLKGYSVRLIGSSVNQKGDPIPRVVYHCNKSITNVLIIGGKGKSGKSTLALQLGDNKPIISVDNLIRPKRAENATISDLQSLIDQNLKKENRSIRKMWEKLKNNHKIRAYLAEAITESIKKCRYSDTIIVEGYIAKDILAEIEKKLGNEYKCWYAFHGPF